MKNEKILDFTISDVPWDVKVNPKNRITADALRHKDYVNVIEVYDQRGGNHHNNLVHIEGRGWTVFKMGGYDILEHCDSKDAQKAIKSTDHKLLGPHVVTTH